MVLLNGEKFVPTSFEQAVRHNKHVTEAVMFGNGKARVGMLIIPSPMTKDLSEEAILQNILPTLVAANEATPAYAKLSLEMVRILPTGTEYPRTDKGTVIRAAFYRTFATQIDEIWEALERPTGSLCLSEPELRENVRSTLLEILGPTGPPVLEDEMDFFSIGVDSLQAIQLRSSLSKTIQTNNKVLSSNVVFDFPTVKALARHLYCLRTGEAIETEPTEKKIARLISKYSVYEEHLSVPTKLEGNYLVSWLIPTA
jgi:acyl carrier protein